MDKNKLMLMIIIVLLVLLLGTVGFVSVFLLTMGGNDDGDILEYDFRPPVIVNQPSLPTLEPIVLGEDMILTHLLTAPDGRTATVRCMIVVGINVTDEDGDGFAFIDEFSRRVDIARGIAITVMNGLTYDEVRTPEGQGMVAELIKLRLQEDFETHLIVSVHLTNG